MATTLAQLRQRLQTLFDVNGSAVLTTTEQNQLINDGYRSLWADVVSVNKTFRTSVDTFTITTGQTRALPADFQETLFVRQNPGLDSQVYLPQFPAENGSQAYDRSYRLQDSNLVIEPIQRAPGNYDHTYVVQPKVLVNDTDTLDVELDQFQDYVAYHAAVAALAREESPIDQLAAVLATVRERVVKWAATRRSSAPIAIKNVRSYRPWGWPSP